MAITGRYAEQNVSAFYITRTVITVVTKSPEDSIPNHINVTLLFEIRFNIIRPHRPRAAK
jgi:hypothetical protein